MTDRSGLRGRLFCLELCRFCLQGGITCGSGVGASPESGT